MIKTNFSKINREIVARDNHRYDLLRKGKLLDFKKTYTKAFDVPNLNTGDYWDDIFSDETNSLANQSPMTKDKIRTIAKIIKDREIRILDIGMGHGFIEELLSEKGSNTSIHGLDISSHSIARAKKLFKGTFNVGDVTNLEKIYPKNSFNLILALEVFEHINPSQILKLYSSINKLLKKNGELILSIPINEHLERMKNNPSAHVRNYSPAVIRSELKLGNFDITQEHYLSAFDSLYGIKKQVAKLLNIWEKNSMIVVAKKK